jgi:hypothetical protein
MLACAFAVGHNINRFERRTNAGKGSLGFLWIYGFIPLALEH